MQIYSIWHAINVSHRIRTYQSNTFYVCNFWLNETPMLICFVLMMARRICWIKSIRVCDHHRIGDMSWAVPSPKPNQSEHTMSASLLIFSDEHHHGWTRQFADDTLVNNSWLPNRSSWWSYPARLCCNYVRHLLILSYDSFSFGKSMLTLPCILK